VAARWIAIGMVLAATTGQERAAPPPPAAEASGDDIVVIARKLRKVRLDYAVHGGDLTRCTPTGHGTEPRIGRIMCAILRACVAEGAQDVEPARQCMTRRINALDDPAPAPRTLAAAAPPPAPRPSAPAAQAAPTRPVPTPAPATAQAGDVVVTARPETDSVVVVGRTPMVRGGLWRFERSATLMMGTPAAGGLSDDSRISRSIAYSVCLQDGELEQLMREAAAFQARLGSAGGTGMLVCNRLSFRFRPGRLDGHRSCFRNATLPTRLSMNGRFDARGLTINYLEEQDYDGLSRASGPNLSSPTSQRWRVTASRQDVCPAKPRSDQRLPWELGGLLFSPVSPEN